MADGASTPPQSAAIPYEINRLKPAVPWPPFSINPLLPIGYDAQSRAATTFSGFRKVPIELRLMIWNEAIPDNRLVEVRWDQRSRQFWSTSIPPALFQTTPESRDLVKQLYSKLTLSFNDGGANHIYTWINYDKDTLYMCPSYCSSGLSDLIGKFFSTSKAFSTLSNLQSLALECQHSVYFPNRYLCNFQRLAKLYLVFSDVCVQRIWPMTRGYVPIRKIEYFKVKSPVDGTASRWDATYGVQESFFLSTNSCSYRFRHMSRYYSERHISRGGLEVCAIDIVRA